jgi:hypothetical protein
MRFTITIRYIRARTKRVIALVFFSSELDQNDTRSYGGLTFSRMLDLL